MKIVTTTLTGAAALNGNKNHEIGRRWDLETFRWDLPAGDPVEGIIVELDEDGDDLHVVILMSDDHAARLAVSDVSVDTNWEPDGP
jgi:hypothetical protein